MGSTQSATRRRGHEGVITASHATRGQRGNRTRDLASAQAANELVTVAVPWNIGSTKREQFLRNMLTINYLSSGSINGFTSARKILCTSFQPWVINRRV